MREKFIKLGAFLELIIGILMSIVLTGGGVLVYTLYPDANSYKKVLVALGLVIVGTIALVITIAVFEAMLSLAHVSHLTCDNKGWDEEAKEKT